MRIATVLSILAALVVLVAACSSELEVTREVPVTVQVTREVPATVEVTREVPATVEVTREVPATVEVTRQIPLPVEVEVVREVEVTRVVEVEVVQEVLVEVEVTREVPADASGQQVRPIAQSRLKLVRDRGKLVCASRNNVPGFGYADAAGKNAGFDIDLCRAVAVAVLGDPSAVEVRLITAAERGPTILSGEVDLLVRTVTWVASRDAEWGNYVQIMLYDGQGFLIRKGLGLGSALELQGAKICVVQGTTTELNLHEFSNNYGLDISAFAFEDTGAALQAYQDGQCDALTNDRSQLAAMSRFLENPASHTVLPETISEEPLGPVVPHGDDQWFDIVKTVMAILIHGEAQGITSESVPDVATGLREVDTLLGFSGSFGQSSLGLSRTVAQGVLKAVGNYGEIYERHLGPRNINLPREGTRNALWAEAPCEECPKGGQIYAPPLR